MFAKILAVILALGVVACVLLTTRQQRLQSVHDLAVIQKRVAEHDRTLWTLRVAIASKLNPARIEHLASSLGDLDYLPSVGGMSIRAIAESADRNRELQQESPSPNVTRDRLQATVDGVRR